MTSRIINQVKKLVLFDIDGTLIDRANGHVEAFAIAFREVYGVNASIHIITPEGMTDQEIIRAVLSKVGVAEGVIEAKMRECMSVMVDFFTSIQPMLHIRLLPGVKEIIEHLHNEGYLIGLVTGNLEPIARGKMQLAGLDRFISVGGFGSDAADRSDLVRRAIEQAQREHALELGADIHLIGDAPQDVRAALAGGAKPIGVTTGRYSKEELTEAGASEVVPSLADQERLMDLLGG